MIDVGYSLVAPLYGLTDEAPRRIGHSEMKGWQSNDTEIFMKCPAIQDYVKNTYLLPLHFYGSFKINGIDGDGNLSVQNNLKNMKNVHVKDGGNGEFLFEAEGSGYFFFSDIPGVYAIVQPAPNSPIKNPVRTVLDIYQSPRSLHPAWFARQNEEFTFERGSSVVMVTFVTPNNEAVNLVPCHETDLEIYLNKVEQDNRDTLMMSWSKLFKRQSISRPQNQIEKFRIKGSD